MGGAEEVHRRVKLLSKSDLVGWHCVVLVNVHDPRQVHQVHLSCEQSFAKGGSERRRCHRRID